jgi:hypothetical protein
MIEKGNIGIEEKLLFQIHSEQGGLPFPVARAHGATPAGAQPRGANRYQCTRGSISVAAFR